MRVYFGLFGRRSVRPCGGFCPPFLGGAIGIGRDGPWVKFSEMRMLRRLFG